MSPCRTPSRLPVHHHRDRTHATGIAHLPALCFRHPCDGYFVQPEGHLHGQDPRALRPAPARARPTCGASFRVHRRFGCTPGAPLSFRRRRPRHHCQCRICAAPTEKSTLRYWWSACVLDPGPRRFSSAHAPVGGVRIGESATGTRATSSGEQIPRSALKILMNPHGGPRTNVFSAVRKDAENAERISPCLRVRGCVPSAALRRSDAPSLRRRGGGRGVTPASASPSAAPGAPAPRGA